MLNRSTNRLTGLSFLAVLMFPTSSPLAALDDFSPYAYARVVHDTNIFRSNDDEENETVGHLGAGLRTDLKLSRQHLIFEGLVDRAEYSDFDELDHTRADATATWAWEVGNLWSGDLGYNYDHQMSSFEQQLVRDKDMRTTKTGFFEVGYLLHPDWRLSGLVNYSDVSYQERERLERDTSTGQFEVHYRNTLNTRVGASIRYSKNDLNDTDLGGGEALDNDYDETTVSALFSWEASGKSTLEARLGYTTLSYDELNDRDFEGGSGRITWKWLVTGKTKVDISAWQETSSLDDEIADYVLSRGVGIKPQWSATPKISVEGDFSYENNDFKGSNEIRKELGLQKRDDDIWKARVTANWDPRRYLRFSVGYKRSERQSSLTIRDYDNNQVDAKVRFSF